VWEKPTSGFFTQLRQGLMKEPPLLCSCQTKSLSLFVIIEKWFLFSDSTVENLRNVVFLFKYFIPERSIFVVPFS
jgi:hypothetical protein